MDRSGLGTIVDEAIGQMPEPTGQLEEAIEPIQSADPATPDPRLRDKKGTLFDAEIHAMKGGEPVTKADGSYAKKRGRRKGGTLPTASAAPEKAAARQTAQHAGKATAELIFVLCELVLGSDWKPRDDTEKAAVEDAWANWYEATGRTEIGPGWTLVIVMAFYSLPRVTTKETKKRGSAIWRWTKPRVFWLGSKLGLWERDRGEEEIA